MKRANPQKLDLLFLKTISPLKNLEWMKKLYIVSFGHYAIGVKNEMVAEILL